MTLGADAFHVKRMILGDGWVLLADGLLLGITSALLVRRLLSTLPYGVTPNDPLTASVVALVTTAVGTVPCWISAGRAARVEPATALRAE